MIPRRSSPSCAQIARHELVFGRPVRIATTMQSYASAAKLRGGGPILNRGAKTIVQYRVAATSVHQLQLGIDMDTGLQQLSRTYTAGLRTRPAGIWPVVTSRHSATRSLRASATIIVLRVPPRVSEVRFHATILSRPILFRESPVCAAVTKPSTGAAAICGRGGVKSSQW